MNEKEIIQYLVVSVSFCLFCFLDVGSNFGTPLAISASCWFNNSIMPIGLFGYVRLLKMFYGFSFFVLGFLSLVSLCSFGLSLGLSFITSFGMSLDLSWGESFVSFGLTAGFY